MCRKVSRIMRTEECGTFRITFIGEEYDIEKLVEDNYWRPPEAKAYTWVPLSDFKGLLRIALNGKTFSRHVAAKCANMNVGVVWVHSLERFLDMNEENRAAIKQKLLALVQRVTQGKADNGRLFFLLPTGIQRAELEKVNALLTS